VTLAAGAAGPSLEELIKNEARRLGFVLAGVSTPDPPPHVSVFEEWLTQGRHGSMRYLSEARSRLCRADPCQLMPECRSIIVLAVPYSNPGPLEAEEARSADEQPRGRVAAYAWGQDYHDVLPERLRGMVAFIEQEIGRPVAARCFTDSAPILERDLAQRAGLGWIGKNTCLINPHHGSYFFLAELLLDVVLEPDPSFEADRCGKCRRCIDACPTNCILEDRTLDARRCISYLTIELRDEIPVELRPRMANWVFGCDICQAFCPWNRFGPSTGDPAFGSRGASSSPLLLKQLQLTAEEFRRQSAGSAVRRARHAGYQRNLAVAAGNIVDREGIPTLRAVAERGESLAQEHALWAIRQISDRNGPHG